MSGTAAREAVEARTGAGAIGATDARAVKDATGAPGARAVALGRLLSPRRVGAACRAFWRALRTVTGDDAYERYLRHHAERHAGSPPLSRREFFESEQRRQWSRINRCC